MKIINLYLPFCQQGWSQYFPRPPPRCPMCQKPNDSIRKLRCEIFVFFSLVPSKREKNILVLLTLYIFEGGVFSF